jgi:hypothetical protein
MYGRREESCLNVLRARCVLCGQLEFPNPERA